MRNFIGRARLMLIGVALSLGLAPAVTRADDASQAATVVACTSAIASCGCTITKPGHYAVTHDLTIGQGLTAKNGCIDIKASKVFLLLNGYAITGDSLSKTGTGLHVLPGANGVFVEAVRGESSTAAHVVTTLSNWDVGIEWDGNNGILEDFVSSDNASVGVLLNKASSNVISDFTANSNGIYGMWIKASSSNQVECDQTSSNGNVGLYVGCAANGPTGAKCKGVGPSNNNLLYDDSENDNSHYGIAIDLGNGGARVSTDFLSGNSTADLIDKNPDCGTNVWYANNFTTEVSDTNCIE